MPKASVAVAMIAKDAEKTLGACLESLAPFVEQIVVCVDALTTDKTAEVAIAHGAEVHAIEVSAWHDCPIHGHVLAQHFGRARDESFAYLRKDVEWYLWIDSDDVFRGGDQMAAYLNGLPAEVDGVWLPYNYARVEDRLDMPVTTRFDRERFLRTRIPWEWQHRVHEIAAPKGRKAEELTWAQTDLLQIDHQGKGHDIGKSARRNILLLEMELEERPGDQWALFYLGNQYYAIGDWPMAVQAYEAATKNDNVYQLWQTYVYLSMSYEKVGRLDDARGAAYRAMDLIPNHAEPYYRLATLWMLQGQDRKTEFWTRLGDAQVDPPGFVFRNPLDRMFNSRVSLGQAFANAGRFRDALDALTVASRTVKNPDVDKGVADMRQRVAEEETANAVVRLLGGQDDRRVLETFDALELPRDVLAFGRVRDVVVPALLRRRMGTQPRVVFVCGRSAEPWYPGSIDTTGIGGSETAVIQIARRFAADGWRVDVFNDPDRYEGEYDAVGYWAMSRMAGDESADVAVSWRRPDSHGVVAAPVQLLWCHDLNKGPTAREPMARFDRVLGVSKWHADYLAMVYGLRNTDFVPNGIELDRFSEKVAKVPFRCVHASSPDRALSALLVIWQTIVEAEPKAELHVAYGWETIDRYIQLGHRDLLVLKERLQKQMEKTPGVVWRGRLSQRDLARLYQESYLWLYPSTFLEVSCISAMEAMAGGAVPVTSATGALRETIGDAGLVVDGNPYTQAWRQYYGLIVGAAMVDTGIRRPFVELGRERVKGFTWDAAFSKWKQVLDELSTTAKKREEEREVVPV